jgi:hypothetical protein
MNCYSALTFVDTCERNAASRCREALGRSRGGFSTKIHLRTNAKGDPLIFDVTGGEAHEVKGYDALMELHDINPAGSWATRAMTATIFATTWQIGASSP